MPATKRFKWVQVGDLTSLERVQLWFDWAVQRGRQLCSARCAVQHMMGKGEGQEGVPCVKKVMDSGGSESLLGSGSAPVGAPLLAALPAGEGGKHLRLLEPPGLRAVLPAAGRAEQGGVEPGSRGDSRGVGGSTAHRTGRPREKAPGPKDGHLGQPQQAGLPVTGTDFLFLFFFGGGAHQQK